MKDHIQALKKIIGESNVLTKASDKIAYETPWRGEKGNAAFVIRPKNTGEVSQVLAYLNAHHIPIIAQSGNTGLVAASTPDQTGQQVVLNLNRLNQNFQINPVNKSAHVGAGMNLSMLNKVAAKHDLFFPIDLGSDPCIGGMVATNTGGARLLKYGDVRQNLLGLTVVLMDGTILDLNNALHKNNTGLDLKQLFIGTGGTNGIITECVVKLSTLPKQSATALIVPMNNDSVPRLLIELEACFGDELSAFEGMSKNAIEATFAHNQSSLKNGFHDGVPDYACLVELNRTWLPRDNEHSLDDVLQTGLAHIMENDETLIEDALFGHSSEHWKLRHAMSEAVQRTGKMVAFDVSFERDKAMAFRSFIQQALPERFADVKIFDFGHIGDGAMHFNLIIDPDDVRLENIDFIPNLKKWIFEKVVQDFGGSYSAEHGVGPLNKGAYDRYTDNTIKSITHGIQRLCTSGFKSSQNL